MTAAATIPGAAPTPAAQSWLSIRATLLRGTQSQDEGASTAHANRVQGVYATSLVLASIHQYTYALDVPNPVCAPRAGSGTPLTWTYSSTLQWPLMYVYVLHNGKNCCCKWLHSAYWSLVHPVCAALAGSWCTLHMCGATVPPGVCSYGLLDSDCAAWLCFGCYTLWAPLILATG